MTRVRGSLFLEAGLIRSNTPNLKGSKEKEKRVTIKHNLYTKPSKTF